MQTRRHATRALGSLSHLQLASLSSSPRAARSFTAVPDRYAFPSLLKIAASRSDLSHGRALHAAGLKNGLVSDPFIAASLVSMYSKCTVLSDAVDLFDGLPERDTATWNSMIDGFFRHGRRKSGFSCFHRMQLAGVRPDRHSLSIVLSDCGNSSDIKRGRQAHAHLLKNISDPDPFLATSLIDMYLKCGRLSPALRVFDSSLGKEDEENVCVWNAMIGGLRQIGLWEKSFEFYALMKSHSVAAVPATFSSLLAGCSHGGDSTALAETIHSDVIKTGLEGEPFVCTSLLATYGRCGSMDSAAKVFAGTPDKKTELFNAMIAACNASGRAGEAILVYGNMNRRSSGGHADSFTISNALAACSSSVDFLDLGRAIHGQSVKLPEGRSVSVSTSLVTMYGRWGKMEESAAVFDFAEEKDDEVLWGSMIAGLCQNKMLRAAISLVNQMLSRGWELDSAVLTSVASAAVKLEQPEIGFQVHGHAVKSGMEADTFVGSALVDLYAKSGLLDSAGEVFAAVPEKNIVAWNSIISGFGRAGDVARCVAALNQMLQSGPPPDSISVTAALVAATSAAALSMGKMIHAFQIRNYIRDDAQVGNSLIDMYSSSGCLRYARQVFEGMSVRTVATWNSMISGYGSHGHCDAAVGLFQEMQSSPAALPPDEITFLALISACSHSGQTEEGLEFFRLMTSGHRIAPSTHHCASVVDLLGRAGRLEQAFRFAAGVPPAAGGSVWLSLLAACRVHGNVEAGEAAARRLRGLDPEAHVQLWKLYGEGGLPEKAAAARGRMRAEGLKKKPGCSWIEVRGHVEVFFSGNSLSPLGVDAHAVLNSLRGVLRDEHFFSKR
ncbi:unnamed protein product [Spirodela intermedia]|uniref:Uncharacterized protein n=2 Tax=Spirodela intermedia TaxID=51605 RepID=A0A7I8L8G3_SPIIN|nr:unnamed protein product [Spirodela intermedia]CAA6669233.1 unnamed protein product [Spirodela intermedia]CAA7406180.1 unnamed protein product [Spirodela intermedia]